MLQTTVGRMFRDTAERFSERPCMETPEQSYTYAETLALAEKAACALARCGVGKGSRVAVWCKDSPEFLLLYLGLELLGSVPVLLNTSLTGTEAAALMKKVGANAVYYDDGFKETSFPEEAAKHALPGARYIPDFLRELPEPGPEERRALRGITDALRPEDPDVIIFTSGTSGTAKGVLSTHLARVNVARVQAETISLTEEDKSCVAIPMFHCFGLTGVILAALYSGGCLYFPGGRHTKQLLEAMSVHGCTVFSAVPTLFSAILARLDLEQFDLHTLRTGYIGGSVYTPEFFRRVERAMHFRLAPSLGQTEATAGLTFISPEEPEELRAPSVGRFMEGLEGEIRDIESGKPLGTGKTGEICIRGWSVMKEYVGEPELTKSVLEPDGWLHTGDLAWLDEERCLHMNGRLKELIIRGGENISPGEIEAVIGQDPRVREVKCVAVPDAHYGEEICACVVLREGASGMKEEHIRSLAAGHLAAYKVPRYVLFMDSLPRTGSGKLALKKLKDSAAEALHLS
ncbi:MAG: acyl--CoA ligase [Oscillospiraceae bacterium]|nr:acyl--CoA ligase [Oscillospiraceae bacterium]